MATREAVVPPADDPIMSVKSILLFRYLKCQNPSIISDSIGIPHGGEKSGKMSEEQEEQEMAAESYSYRRGYLYI